jgi:predicted DNA-binding transcriptional regulator AlpA
MSDLQQAPTGSSSIREFCARHGISVSSYYELTKSGLMPRSFKLGKIRRISHRAEADWLAEREADGGAK